MECPDYSVVVDRDLEQLGERTRRSLRGTQESLVRLQETAFWVTFAVVYTVACCRSDELEDMAVENLTSFVSMRQVEVEGNRLYYIDGKVQGRELICTWRRKMSQALESGNRCHVSRTHNE